jgi:hypothetical protein
MISLWAWVEPSDVEAYAASLLLPDYMSHLHLAPVAFASQAPHRDGREPLVLTYVGEGRLEEFRLEPEEHALGLLRPPAPGVIDSRVQLPRDDASWSWSGSEGCGEKMRVCFAPTTAALGVRSRKAPSDQAYLSVSRGHVFVGRALVEDYLRAWLEHLGLRADAVEVALVTPSGAVELSAGAIGGQMLLDDVTIRDLLGFARLDAVLSQLGEFAVLASPDASIAAATSPEGVYISLAPP